MRCCLKSPASRLFTQPFIQKQIKGNIKTPRPCHLCREFTSGRWIPGTNGQLRGKCFHLMTSSWLNLPTTMSNKKSTSFGVCDAVFSIGKFGDDVSCCYHQYDLCKCCNGTQWSGYSIIYAFTRLKFSRLQSFSTQKTIEEVQERLRVCLPGNCYVCRHRRCQNIHNGHLIYSSETSACWIHG